MNLRAVFSSLLGMWLLSVVAASADQVQWPSSDSGWYPLTMNGGLYTDALSDYNPSVVDIVGGNDGSTGSYTAGYWYLDTTADQLMFRMRLDNWGANPKHVWQVPFDTSPDIAPGGTDIIDYALELDPKSDLRVEFVPATSGGPNWNVNMSPHVTLDGANAIWSSPLADPTGVHWRVTSPVGDGSLFGGTADAFLDLAMPYSVFLSTTGLSAGAPFRLALTTSADHNNVNKDNPGEPASGYLTDPTPGPSFAEITSFSVTREGRSLAFSWQTAPLFDLAGFNLFGLQGTPQRRVAVNDALIPVRPSAAGADYRVTWNARGREAAEYALEAVGYDGGRRIVGRARP